MREVFFTVNVLFCSLNTFGAVMNLAEGAYGSAAANALIALLNGAVAYYIAKD